jgi:hypothetical protein
MSGEGILSTFNTVGKWLETVREKMLNVGFLKYGCPKPLVSSLIITNFE